MLPLTLLQATIGWAGTIMFFYAGWLMGSKHTAQRRTGIFAFVLVNTAFFAQSWMIGNWPLLVMSGAGALLHTRAWFNWEQYEKEK